MSADNVFLVFFSLLVILLCSAEETQVSCVFNESCVLPCSFQSGSEPAIHWFKTPGDVPFHSYYNGQNQLLGQNQDFKDRTSLFVDQISRGNASLLLREVKVQDEGTYRCYTGTAHSEPKDFFINLRVRASVSFVNIEQRGDELICSSKDIYPKPDVSWSPDVEPKTSVSVSEKGLYSIFSSVPLSHKPPEEHSCNISTDHSWSSATYRLQLYSISGNEVTVPCSASSASIKSLVWKFNQTQTILTQTGTNRVYNESWRQFVEEVSESGRLTLKNLDSGHHGVYSCVLSSDRETHISDTIVRVDPPSTTVYIVVGVLLFLLFIMILIILVLSWKRQKDLQRFRKVERKKEKLRDELQKVKDELDSDKFSDDLQELEDELVSLDKKIRDGKNRRLRGRHFFRPFFRVQDRQEQTEESEETRAAEGISLQEPTGENQQLSELSQVLKRLRELEEENKQLKEENKKLKDRRLKDFFHVQDRQEQNELQKVEDQLVSLTAVMDRIKNVQEIKERKKDVSINNTQE